MRVVIGPNGLGLEQVIDELKGVYPEVQFTHCADRAVLDAALPEAQVYFGWLGREQFLTAKKLKWLQSPSSGVDRFLAIPELRDGPVILTSARGTHGACLADSVMGMVLAFTRGIRECILAQPGHHWAARARPRLIELTGKTMGIVGLGTVGRAVAKRAQAFDMRIVAVDAFPGEKTGYVERVDGLDGLHTLLAESDVVVVTVPYTPQNAGLIGAPELAQLKPSTILVGISRGGIIDETALAAALHKGRLAGAALDVFVQEPLPEDSPLWDVPNLLITPHIAGGSQFEGPAICEIFKENLARYTHGEFPLRNQVDKLRGF
ncbi:MAG: D-2-hydroxyacid dehydrogenase [Anaerolineae bacterium]|nr:D-2-hydroxyacid dehydrogenase [Anaerolineae bacterium]